MRGRALEQTIVRHVKGIKNVAIAMVWDMKIMNGFDNIEIFTDFRLYLPDL